MISANVADNRAQTTAAHAAEKVAHFPATRFEPLRCELKVISTVVEFDAARSQWVKFLQRPTVECDFFTDPHEIQRHVAYDRGDRLLLGQVFRGGHLVAIVPLIWRRVRTPVRFGLVTVCRLSIRAARLVNFEFPREPGVDPFDVFAKVVEACAGLKHLADLLFVDSVPVQSQSGREHGFRIDDIQSSYIIEIEGSFESYIHDFSPKSRKNLMRTIRKLSETASQPVRAVSFRTPAEMDSLYPALRKVYEKSWQGRLSRQPLPSATHLRALAAQGWIRSYVLFVGDQPIASLRGFQYGNTFHYFAPAYDSDWQEHSPGTVLLYHLIKDLFAVDSPARLDFGFSYNQYKQVFGTHEVMRGTIGLGVTARGKLVVNLQAVSTTLFRLFKAALGPTGIPRLIKRKMRQGR